MLVNIISEKLNFKDKKGFVIKYNISYLNLNINIDDRINDRLK